MIADCLLSALSDHNAAGFGDFGRWVVYHHVDAITVQPGVDLSALSRALSALYKAAPILSVHLWRWSAADLIYKFRTGQLTWPADNKK